MASPGYILGESEGAWFALGRGLLSFRRTVVERRFIIQSLFIFLSHFIPSPVKRHDDDNHDHPPRTPPKDENELMVTDEVLV